MDAKSTLSRVFTGNFPDPGEGSPADSSTLGRNVFHSCLRYTKPMRKGIVLVGMLMALQSASPAAQSSIYADRIAASVNGDVILESDVNAQRQPFIRSLINLPLGVIPPGKRPTDRELLEELIVIKLLEQEAARKNITLDDRAVDAVIDSIKKRNKNMTQDMLVMYLAANGLSYSEFRKLMILQFKLNKLIESEVTKKMPLSEEDAQNYFKANRDKIDDHFVKLVESLTPSRPPEEMARPEIPTHEEIFEGGTLRLRQITLKLPPGARRQDMEKVQALGKRIFQEVLTGADFAKLAQQYSQDSLAKKGGDLGSMNYKEMVPQLQKMVQRMKPGDVTPPLGSKDQIVLFYLAEAKGRHSRNVPIPEKQRKLMEERLKQEYERQAAQMREQAQAASKAPQPKKPESEEQSSPADTTENLKTTSGILTPEEAKEYNKVRDKVMFILRTEKTQEKIKEWIGQLKQDSIIEVKL